MLINSSYFSKPFPNRSSELNNLEKTSRLHLYLEETRQPSYRNPYPMKVEKFIFLEEVDYDSEASQKVQLPQNQNDATGLLLNKIFQENCLNKSQSICVEILAKYPTILKTLPIHRLPVTLIFILYYFYSLIPKHSSKILKWYRSQLIRKITCDDDLCTLIKRIKETKENIILINILFPLLEEINFYQNRYIWDETQPELCKQIFENLGYLFYFQLLDKVSNLSKIIH